MKPDVEDPEYFTLILAAQDYFYVISNSRKAREIFPEWLAGSKVSFPG